MTRTKMLHISLSLVIPGLVAPLALGEEKAIEPGTIHRGDDTSPDTPVASSPAIPKTMDEYLALLQLEKEGRERIERENQQKLEEIQKESYCVTAEKLVFEEMFAESALLGNFTSTSAILNSVHNESRFLKLLDLAKSENEAMRAEAASCLTEALNVYLNHIPISPTNSDLSKSEMWVLAVRGASVAALLLAEYDQDGSSLPFIAQLHTRCQEATHAIYRADAQGAEEHVEYISSFDGAVFGAAEKILLEKLKQGLIAQHKTYSFDTSAVLEEYEKLDPVLNEATRGEEGNAAKFTRDLREQSELFRIARLSLISK